jgi:hypothetical protein
VHSDRETVEEGLAKVLSALRERGLLPGGTASPKEQPS